MGSATNRNGPLIPVQRTLLAIARGEADWRELLRFGIEPGLDRDPPSWWEPGSIPVVEVGSRDLALGLLVHLASPAALRQWAQVIEMSGCFDLDRLPNDPDADTWLNAIWSASCWDEIDAKSLSVIRRLAEPAFATT